MTFLVGALGRAAVGEAIEKHGYANIFYVTAGLGMIAVVLVLIEWWRPAPLPQGEPIVSTPEGTPESASA